MTEKAESGRKKDCDKTAVPRPCKPLFRPVWAFGRQGGIRVPLGGILPRVAAWENGWGNRIWRRAGITGKA